MWPSRWNKLFVLSLLFLMFFAQPRSSGGQPIVTPPSGGSVSDTAYGAGWDGDTTTAASKNALYDKIETIGGGTPGGATTQLQYNNTGSFDGMSGCTTSDETDITCTGALAGSNLSGTNSGDQTLDTVFNQGKIIDGANSLANAMQVCGDGNSCATNPGFSIYCDGANDCTFAIPSGMDRITEIPANQNYVLYDTEGASAIETVDPDAASSLAMYTYASGYRPLESIEWLAGGLSSDGTQCADPAEVTINSGPKQFSIICADNDASRMHGSVKMPDNWDAGTVTFEVTYIQTAADTAVLNMDVACQGRGAGETVNSTYGTEVAIDDAALTGSNALDATASAAVTCNCTTACAAGDMLYWYLDIDATGTTTAVATLNFMAVKMEYGITSRSQ